MPSGVYPGNKGRPRLGPTNRICFGCGCLVGGGGWRGGGVGSWCW